MMNTIKRLVLEEEGQGMAEYALILVFIAVVCIVGFKVLGNAISDKVDEVGGNITSGS